MKKRTKLFCSFLLLTLALTVAVTTIWLAPSQEPSHQGRPLSGWLTDLVATDGEPHAVAAVQAIGTNAVPYLLQGFSYSYSRRREIFYNAANTLFHRTFHFAAKPIYDPAQVRFLGAVRGFEALGSTASNAVPHLSQLLGTRNGSAAAWALSDIGPAALPALTEALSNTSPTVRYHALVGVAHLRTNAAQALSAVVRCLADTNLVSGTPVRDSAIIALGEMHGQAIGAVPALTLLLDSSDVYVRALATQSLEKIKAD